MLAACCSSPPSFSAWAVDDVTRRPNQHGAVHRCDCKRNRDSRRPHSFPLLVDDVFASVMSGRTPSPSPTRHRECKEPSTPRVVEFIKSLFSRSRKAPQEDDNEAETPPSQTPQPQRCCWNTFPSSRKGSKHGYERRMGWRRPKLMNPDLSEGDLSLFAHSTSPGVG